ncbi:hypothetical protein RND81_04G242500 [Saponaria officinalis]|uniref:Neprosin PEP catalytic domain-containing protein n=1 Tax=Saponaria officinalis TaxID=3572 RepID=A0AAW1LPH5_SAPOF
MVNKVILFVILASLPSIIVSEKMSHVKIKINGQIYNCVDFYKQPSFNQSLSKAIPNIVKVQQQNRAIWSGPKSRGCPIGTVPILDRLKVKMDRHVDLQSYHTPPPLHDLVQCSAVYRTVDDDSRKKFLGANAHISLYNPNNVKTDQWSSARIKLINGFDSIEAGWMVNPDEYKDNYPHLYASFTAGEKGCISLDCPGFMQVSTDIPLGTTSKKYSTIGGEQSIWNISITKRENGHWWLSIKDGYKIGYWPESLFTTLKDVAHQVEFGGEINTPKAVDPEPSMGNGLKPSPNNHHSACFTFVTVVDEDSKHVDPLDTENFNNCESQYLVRDYGYRDDLGRVICYGGPRSE